MKPAQPHWLYKADRWSSRERRCRANYEAIYPAYGLFNSSGRKQQMTNFCFSWTDFDFDVVAEPREAVHQFAL